MRPLRLDITGFAAFRDATTVDFASADYFALTGPTGSGKSTVIDAMTFALYGSAPRWGRENAIQYALAPTANRCAVRLVFDVAGQRYVAAREVRRSGKSITQRNPRLERYLDPTATGDPVADEPTESLAADSRAVRQQVSELLGLDFEDFCTCVVLPQGDFATFLQASVGERQNILLKLLGARHYESIGRIAGKRATEANARIDALQGQLASYHDATADAEKAAQAREVTLGVLHATVSTEAENLRMLLGRRAATAGRADGLADQIGALDAVTTPTGVQELQRALAAADETYRLTSAAARDADDVMQHAESAVAAGPQPGPLEEAVRWHRERSRDAARAPEATAAVEATASALAAARQAAERTEVELAACRDDHERRRAVHERSETAISRLGERIKALRTVTVPDGTADLDSAAVAARAAIERADERLVTAEAAVAECAAAVSELPERAAITALQRTVEAFATASSRLHDLQQATTELTSQIEEADAEAGQTRAAHERARAEVETLLSRSVAADLRPHLQVGHACPVCDQTVATLPTALVAPELDGARSAAAEADGRQRAADASASRLRARLGSHTAQVEETTRRVSELDATLRQDLPGQPAGDDRDPAQDRAAAADLLARLENALTCRDAAVAECEVARGARREAEQSRTRIASQTERGWAAWHATYGRLAALGAPPMESVGLAADWHTLTTWATSTADGLSAEDVVAAQSALTAAELDLAEATDRLTAAATDNRRASDTLTAAAAADGKARSERDDLVRRLADLDRLLADRPTEAAARQLLAQHHQLAQAAAGSSDRRDGGLARSSAGRGRAGAAAYGS